MFHLCKERQKQNTPIICRDVPLNEVTAKIFGWMTYDLQANVVPGLSRRFGAIKHILEWLV
jgi:hypothetical protein